MTHSKLRTAPTVIFWMVFLFVLHSRWWVRWAGWGVRGFRVTRPATKLHRAPLPATRCFLFRAVVVLRWWTEAAHMHLLVRKARQLQPVLPRLLHVPLLVRLQFIKLVRSDVSSFHNRSLLLYRLNKNKFGQEEVLRKVDADGVDAPGYVQIF